MLYYLSQELTSQFPVFNIFRYITFRTGGALITTAVLVFLFGPTIIASLRLRQGKGQPIRADGPETHFVKAGTPTMGGLMILSGVLASSLIWANLTSTYVWVVLAVTVGFGLIGFYDDYLKVKRESHKGFSGRTRLALEFIIAGLACSARKMLPNRSTKTRSCSPRRPKVMAYSRLGPAGSSKIPKTGGRVSPA